MDKFLKGRTSNGSEHWNAKLDPKIVKTVFLDPCSLTDAVNKYNIERSCISRIRSKKSWRQETKDLIQPTYTQAKTGRKPKAKPGASCAENYSMNTLNAIAS